jgi:hypothetical protein
MDSMKNRFYTALVLGAIATATSIAAAQATQTSTDPTLAAAQLQAQLLAAQQALADAKLKIQQDQQGMLTGALPSSTTAPQNGAVTVTGTNPFDSQRLAYTELSNLAAQVAEKVTSPGPVLLYDQTEINSLVNYKSVLKLLGEVQAGVSTLHKAFNDNMDPEAQLLLRVPQQTPTSVVKSFAPILAPGLVLGGLKTMSDLIGMFRTNTSIAFSTFTSDDAALIAAVADKLVSARKMEVYLPAVMPLDLADNTSAFATQLSTLQMELINIQNSAIVDQSKVQQISDALATLMLADQTLQTNTDKTKTKGLANAEESARVFALGLLGVTGATHMDMPTAILWKSQRDQFLRELGQFVTSVGNMVASFGALQTSLTAVTNTGSATLASILRAEKLMRKATAAGATILLVKTSVLGGSVVTRVNLFTGGHLLYTGGAIVNYTLFDATGKVTASGVVIGNTGSKKDGF